MMGTKKILFFISVLGFILVLVSPAFEASIQQSAEELYESAVFKKDVDGDLKAAIELFEKILTQFPDNRKVGAKAQLQIGICSEKLGLEEAKIAFQKVVDQYPDQAEAVRIAKEKLYLLEAAVSYSDKTTSDLTMRKVDFPDGTPSPDGKYISYIDWETMDLALFDITTGETKRLTHAPEDNSEGTYTYPVWVSGSDLIAYTWYKSDMPQDLRIVNMDGAGTKILYSEEERSIGSIAGMTKKGEIIFTLSSRKQPTIIASVSVNDKTFKVIKTVGNAIPYNFTLSPDSKYIAYDFQVQDPNNIKNRDIKVISLDGKLESLLIEHPANDTFIGWTPDGDYVLFTSDRRGSIAIWAIAFSEGESFGDPILIYENLGRFTPLGITDEGKLFYWLSKSGRRDVYTAKMDLETGKVLSAPHRINSLLQGRTSTPSWSPNGKFLVYLVKESASSSPTNYGMLRLHSLHNQIEREISLGLTLRPTQHLKWSTDNNYIFFIARGNQGKKGGLYKLNIQTGLSENIYDSSSHKETDPDLDIFLQEWGSDGSVLFETIINMDDKFDQKKAYLVRTNLKNGTKKTVYQSKEPSMLFKLTLSPDEKWIAFLKRSNMSEKETISIMPSNGGEEMELFQHDSTASIITTLIWGLSGKELFFVKRYFHVDGMEEFKGELWNIPSFDGSNPRKLEFEWNGVRRMIFHPDGQTIAFDADQSEESEVWVMENFLNVINEKKK